MPRRLLLSLAFAVGALGGCFLSPNVPPSFRYTCETDDDCAVVTCRDDSVPWPVAKAQGLKQGCDTDEAKADPTSAYGYRQLCVSGLCQFPCALESYQNDCPTGKGYNFCFNGSCASLCGTDTKRFPDPDATCPSPEKCLIFGEDIDLGPLKALLPGSGNLGGGSSSSSSFGSSTPSISLDDLEGSGVCGVRCDADGAPPCAPGDYCDGAMCLPGCDHDGATPCLEGQECVALGNFSACLLKCDPNVADSCAKDQVCAPFVNVCVPTCVGTNAVECVEGFTCDPDLKICVPDGATTGGATTGMGTSG